MWALFILPMEAFWVILKCEKYFLNNYGSFEELSQAIDEYITSIIMNVYRKD